MRFQKLRPLTISISVFLLTIRNGSSKVKNAFCTEWLGKARTIAIVAGLMENSAVIPIEQIERSIFYLRGVKVMLSADLAQLYGVPVKSFNQSVRRNRARFPEDFMFQLTREEFAVLKSQFVTSSWGGIRRALPYAFTEQGIAMLSSVLRSPRAVRVNIEIMRAFVKLRELLVSNAKLARKLDQLEKRYDHQFKIVFQAIRELMTPPPPVPKRIGFRPGASKK